MMVICHHRGRKTFQTDSRPLALTYGDIHQMSVANSESDESYEQKPNITNNNNNNDKEKV